MVEIEAMDGDRSSPRRVWSRRGAVMAAALLLATACSTADAGRRASDDPERSEESAASTVDGSAIADGSTAPAARRGERPEVHSMRCPFDTAQVTEVECGRVTVPGRGDDPDYEVDIGFARFLATGDEADRRPDPVVFLHGGPGSQVLADAVLRYDSVVAPHIATRDVILYDQRGAGASSPLPSCAAVDGAAVAALFGSATFDDQVAAVVDALADCAERQFGPGKVDPTAFSTIVNVQDLLDLLWALDVSEYNLHGSSYGSRLAQAVLRDAPEGVRSVVLTGVYPTDISPFHHIPPTLETALGAVFAGCRADEVCNEALPDPWASLEALVADLDRDPTWVADVAGRGLFTPDHFDGNQLLNALHGLLYTREGAAMIPDLLLDAEDGDRRRLRRLAESTSWSNPGLVTGLLVVCADEVPFATDRTGIPPVDRPALAELDDAAGLLGPHVPAYCDALGVEWAAGIQDDPVTWEAPTLILSGGADPITPALWARRVADRLPRSRLVVDPRSAHDAASGWCASGLLADFVDRPDRLLDVSCLDPDRPVAVNDAALRLLEEGEPVAVEIRLDGIEPFEILAPPWTESSTDTVHARWRDLDALDPTVLAVVGPDEGADVADLLGLVGYAPVWLSGSSDLTPEGWERSVRIGPFGHLIRYVQASTGLTLLAVVEIGDPDGVEADVLAPAARSFRWSP